MDHTTPYRISPITLGLSAVLFCVSLTLPAVGEIPGGTLLVAGFLGLLDGHVGWYANVFYAAAIATLLFRAPRRGLWLGVTAVALALSTFLTMAPQPWGLLWDGARPEPVFGVGFYLWVAAIATATAECWRMLAHEPQRLGGGRPRAVAHGG